MLNPKWIFLAAVFGAASFANAQPNCVGDWQNDTERFSGLISSGSPFEARIDDRFSIRIGRGKADWHVVVQTDGGETLPIRKTSQGVVPLRGQNPLVTKYIFGPDVLDPALNPDLATPGARPTIAAVEPTQGIKGVVWVFPATADSQTTGAVLDDAHGFSACVSWNDGPREPDLSRYPSRDALLSFPSWVVLAFEDCGLPQDLLLSGRMPRPGYRQRAWLEPDLDGDGLYDLVALVDHADTGRSGLAICSQADRGLEVLGFGDEADPDLVSSSFLAELEWWSVDGRTIILGTEGAGSQRIYRRSTRPLVSEWITD